MSFSYDQDSPTSAKDKVRLAIGDTNSTYFIFHDGEITGLLAQTDQDVDLAAARALRAIAVNSSKTAIYYQVNGLMMDRRDVTRNLIDLAKQFEEKANSTPFEIEGVVDHEIELGSGEDQSNYSDSGC